jgi:hypothetical protein
MVARGVIHSGPEPWRYDSGFFNCVGDEGRYIQPLRGQRGKGSCALCYLCANGERAIRLQVLLETLPSEPGFFRIKSLGFALLAV